MLDLFPDKAHIPFITAPDPPVVAPDSPVDFSVQPPDIIDPFLSSPFNDRSKMNRSKISHLTLTLSLDPLLLLRLMILYKTFHLVTQLG